MKKLRLAISVTMIMALLCLMALLPAQAAENETPLLTIACLSDLHNQERLITDANPQIRGTVASTLTQMAEEEEQVDVVLIGGDVSSDSYTTQAKLTDVLLQVESYTDKLTDNVLWVTGNHDYNAGEGAEKYNSAPYYDLIMKDSVGELSGDDAYYEVYNGENYLLGYHYILGGFDFVAINTSPADMAGSLQNSNYKYTDGVFAWLDATLERIGSEKTVFVLGHLPIAGSNSLNSGKGMLEDSGNKMIDIFKDYPNLIYLYGHDHASDSAYTAEKTIQRVTEYGVDGTVIGGGVPVEPVDTVLGDPLVWKFTASSGGYTLQNLASGKYLGVAGNLNTETESTVWIPTKTGNQFSLQSATDGDSIHYSTSSLTFSHGNATALDLYEKVTVDGAVAYRLVTDIKDGGEYVLVANGNRALTNKLAPENSARMAAMDVVVKTLDGQTVIESVPQSGGIELPDISLIEPSFITSFVGSMRYYNNSIDGMVGANDSQIVQALMIYVYADKIVLQMKNYGTVNGGAQELEPYVITREVVYNDMPIDGDVDASGVVDVADIMKLKDLIMTEDWSAEQLAIGDLSGNGALDVADIMGVKNIIMSA